VNATQQEWRPVVGFVGYYEVSNTGLLRSVNRILTMSDGSTRRQWGQMLTPFTTPRVGYKAFRLSRDGVKHHRYLHRLVLESFVGPCPDGAVACHNDGDHNNNSVGNLRWDSQQSNISDIVKHGRHQNANKTHCKHGHPFDEANTYMNPASGQRVCRTCVREINRRIRIRRKASRDGTPVRS
jgi:hypothetical protein